MPRHNIDPFAQDEDDPSDNVDREVDTFKKEVVKEEAKGGEEAIERLNAPDNFPENEELSVDEPDPKPTREQKRAERSGFEAAFQGQRDENERLQARMVAMEQRFSQPAEPSKAEAQADPAAQQIEGLQQQQKDIHELWQKNYKDMSAEDRTTMQARARKVDDDLQGLKFDQMARQRGFAPARTQDQEQRAQLANRLHSENRDLYDDPQAHQVLLGNFAKARMRGEKESMELHDRVADETRAELGMPLRQGRPSPTDGQKQRLSGRSRGGGTKKGTKGTIRMRPEYYKLADAALGHIKDPVKRYSMWAKTSGKAMVENDEA